ncbi:hypothetical protein SAICODRAFT_77260, partial [Saitoella complicata NRRL Y-17804]|uniref:uncharacterized protein n=1 Tax=Saitoella complicata (strain BCRC 22490 / CBS 7301 / JCM 7358 / NBRC 10748 / NRRL Y-17804) TaxID=698492 RepID=UPI000867FA58
MADQEMSEVPMALPELTEADIESIASLTAHLASSPYDYQSHLTHISLLRRGGPALADELKSARESLHAYFPLTEQQWLEWLSDAKATMTVEEENVHVLELYERAVQDFLSVQLWEEYMDFVQERHWNYVNAPENQLAELFSDALVAKVYEDAVRATQYHVAASSQIWKRYIEWKQGQLESSLMSVADVRKLYLDRLAIPHLDLEGTFSNYSSFVSKYLEADYEVELVAANTIVANTRRLLHAREPFETSLKQSGNSAEAFAEYIHFEFTRREHEIPELRKALYERTMAAHPFSAGIWDEYVLYLIEVEGSVQELVPLLERSVRTCPWSGDLWGHYIRTLERLHAPEEEIEKIKDRAFSTGLLKSSLTETIKVHQAWIGFIKRDCEDWASDEGLEVYKEIKAASKDTLRSFKEKDPAHTLDYLEISIITLLNKPEKARDLFSLIARRGSSKLASFWLRYADWERRHGSLQHAREVYKGACLRPLDDVERVLEAWMTLEEEAGGVEDLERKAKEYAQFQAQVSAGAPVAVEAVGTLVEEAPVLPAGAAQAAVPIDNKRKLEQESSKASAPEPAPKKAKTDETQPQRDREHLTILVQNLPSAITDTRVRQFFRECGTVKSIQLTSTSDSSTAFVEFEAKEDVLMALTRNGRELEGKSIEIKEACGTTLWITNFPPLADEKWMRQTFGQFGEVVDVRFPSLTVNQHRRFCYLQMSGPGEAHAAVEALDGKELAELGEEGKGRLVVKISDPGKKVGRSGAMYEGREIYVTNVDFAADESTLKEFFGKYGTVEQVRLMPTKVPGRHRGAAFVIFGGREEAEKALGADGEKLLTRVLKVEKSEADPRKRVANAAPNRITVEKKAAMVAHADMPPPPSKSEIRGKTLGVMNVAQTVNDAKLRALFEPFGSLRRVNLIPEHGGAVVEFDAVADAGKATMALEGAELSGRHIRIGTYEELM